MPRQNRTLITVMGGMLLLLAAGLTVWLLRDSGAIHSAGSLVLNDAQPEPAESVELPTPLALVESAAPPMAANDSAAAAVAAPSKIPDSYRRALGRLTGRVIESDGSPVAQLKVELAGGRKSLVLRASDAFLDPQGLDFPAIVGAAVTDADGRFELAGLDPRTLGVLLLDPGGPRALLHSIASTPVSGVSTDLGDIVMPDCVTLTGHVVDERGAPVAGARVRAVELPFGGGAVPGADSVAASIADVRSSSALLVPAGTEGADHDMLFSLPASLRELEQHLPIPTTLTALDGSFSMAGVPSGIVTVAVDDGRHLPYVNLSVPTGAPGGTRDLGELMVGDGLTLHGRVVDGKDKPVAGAEVMAGNALVVAPFGLLKGPLRTDADGAFSVAGLREGTVYAAARADSRHEYDVASTSNAAAGVLTIKLAGERELTLSVLDDKRQPILGASIWGRAVEEEETPDFLMPPQSLADHVRPGDGGRYVIGDLHPAQWQIVVCAEGYGQERCMADLLGGDAAAEVQLRPASELVVRVVRAADQAPVEYARVDAFSAKESFGNLITAARTGADGRAHLRNLPPGTLMLQVTHPALAVTTAPATAPSTEELLVPLQLGASIAGSVVDNGGSPAEPLLVFLETNGAPGDAELPRTAITDANGSFRFERVEPGHAKLEARSRRDIQSGLSLMESFINSPLAEAEVEVPVEGEARAVLLVGANGGIDTGFVTGHVTVNGLPGADWKIRTWGKIRRSTVADARGDFDLGTVEAGKVTLMLSAPGSSLMQGFTQTTEVDIARDERKFVNISFATGSITGRVVSAADGSALAGANVQAVQAGEAQGRWGQMGSSATDASGHFAIEPVVAGKYRLNVRADGFANTSSSELEVRAMQQVTGVEVRLSPALVVSGRVVLQGVQGEPQWYWLVATRGGKDTPESEASRDTARVEDKDHTFTFDGLSPGTWTFTLGTDLDQEFATVEVALTHDIKDLVLTFHPAEATPDEPTGETFTYEIK